METVMFELNRFHNGVLKLGRKHGATGLPTRRESRIDLEAYRTQLSVAERLARRPF
jgi:hypothetical protein